MTAVRWAGADPPSPPAEWLREARARFPLTLGYTYLDCATQHPLAVASREAIERYLERQVRGPLNGPEADYPLEQEVKSLFGRLVNALPTEVAFVPSTLAGENLVVAGLAIGVSSRANVVTDELHYNGSLYLYRSLEAKGVEVRIVDCRGWRRDVEAFAAAIDGRTRLVATSLVSNINGDLLDARAVARMAHQRGAWMYLDISQAAGAVPVDVKALDVDFAACCTYKWLMGLRGLGYLYVREDLQGSVLTSTQFGDRQYSAFHYHAFPFGEPTPSRFSWTTRPGAARYEVGKVSDLAVVCQRESLSYLLACGVANVQAYAQPLIQRVREALERIGLESITPEETGAPFTTVLIRAQEEVKARLARANVVAKAKWSQLRVSMSVFNREEDIERLVDALKGS